MLSYFLKTIGMDLYCSTKSLPQDLSSYVDFALYIFEYHHLGNFTVFRIHVLQFVRLFVAKSGMDQQHLEQGRWNAKNLSGDKLTIHAPL